MEEMGFAFVLQCALKPCFQLRIVSVFRQQITQCDPLLAEQAQMQITDRGHPQTITALAEVFSYGIIRPISP